MVSRDELEIGQAGEVETGQPEPAGDAVPEDESVAASAGEYLEMLQRTRAEFENYQKRMRRELDTQRRYAVLPLARDLLPVLDNMQRAIEAAGQSGDSGALAEGVTMVCRQLQDVLQRHEVRPIEALGLTLDPHLHEAVGAQPTTGASPNEILQELQKGYLLHDRVVRPSKVIVAQPPQPAAGRPGAQSDAATGDDAD